MFKGKTTLLIIALVILIIIVIILQITVGRKISKQEENPQKQTKTVTQQQPKSDFYMVSYSTKDGNPIGITDKITVTFSKPISTDQFDFTIVPEAEITFSRNGQGDQLIIEPKQTWDFNKVYRLTINKNIRSEDSRNPDQDIVIEFKTAPYGGI